MAVNFAKLPDLLGRQVVLGECSAFTTNRRRAMMDTWGTGFSPRFFGGNEGLHRGLVPHTKLLTKDEARREQPKQPAMIRRSSRQ